MSELAGAIVICVSVGFPPPPGDLLLPPQLKSNPDHRSKLRTLIARAIEQSLMVGPPGNLREGRARTNRFELYRQDYSAQFPSGTNPLGVVYRRSIERPSQKHGCFPTLLSRS